MLLCRFFIIKIVRHDSMKHDKFVRIKTFKYLLTKENKYQRVNDFGVCIYVKQKVWEGFDIYSNKYYKT